MSLIHRRCACGCEGITNPGNRYIWGHNARNMTEETKMEMSLSKVGNTNRLGHKHSKETKRKMALAQFKCNHNNQYCDAWADKEYKDYLRKNYCENADCKGIYKRLNNHHINLNKKDCRPCNTITLCFPCHMLLHRKLELGKRIKGANYKDYLTIIRQDHITYIHKETRKRFILRRKPNGV